ncbi:hypothetical protein ACV3TA_15130 [Clostridium perfringens]
MLLAVGIPSRLNLEYAYFSIGLPHINTVYLDIPSDSNQHIRDSKLWFENGTWYMFLGNSTVEE